MATAGGDYCPSQYDGHNYTHTTDVIEKPHPPDRLEDDDMELDSPVSSPNRATPLDQTSSTDPNRYQQGQNQSEQQGQNQSEQQGPNQSEQQGPNQSEQQGPNQSEQQGPNQSDQSYQEGQNQYDQPYQQSQGQTQSEQQGQNLSEQQYQQSQGQNQYDQSYQQGQNQYDQSYQQGQNQYDQSYQQGQNQSYQQGQNQYDQIYQQSQGQNQYDQSYQQGQTQYDQSYQQGQNQYDQSYQQRQNQSYQQGQNQYDQSYQQSYSQPYTYYQGQYYPQNYMTPPGGAANYMWPWQPYAAQAAPTYTTPTQTTRGGEWPQWTGISSARGRGRGCHVADNKQSRWDKPKVGQYSSVPPPEQNVSKVTTPTISPPKPDEANTPVKDWPPGLQEYMVRSFESCESEGEKTQVEQYLKVEINEMFRDKRVWQIDWLKEPLPLDKFKHQVQKKKSRWDTPSPSPSLPLPLPLPPPAVNMEQMQGNLQLGQGKKKRKAKRGRGKFFIDRSGGVPVMSQEDKFKVGQRAQRFAKGQEGNKKFKPKLKIGELLKSVSVTGEECDWDSACIEGTCQLLEKRYLRLTSAPDPNTVRPVSVLYQSLELILTKSKEGRDYRYICEQMKSIRQDLTIQGIRNAFTVEVYESHGRIALQNGDWSEFNQCQSQLGALYDEGFSGCKSEFLAYRILYHMMTNESAEFVGVFRGLTAEMVNDPSVIHAMKMRKAWSFGNYSQFFRLYPDTPNFGRHLVDLFIERERKLSLGIITKAYRPSLPVAYISSILSFSSLEECQAFLIERCDAVLDAAGLNVDCRLTHNKLLMSKS